MTYVINIAGSNDTRTVLKLLNESAAWLRERGEEQWAKGFDAARVGPLVARGEVYLVISGDIPIATIHASQVGNLPGPRDADATLWTQDEIAEPAVYLGKLAVRRTHSGNGLGALIIRWILDQAAQDGARWARLDAWDTNSGLHRYYLKNGWTYLRTIDHPIRRSTALFQRPATIDIEARQAFYFGRLSEGPHDLKIGDHVTLDVNGTIQHGLIEAVQEIDHGHEVEVEPFSNPQGASDRSPTYFIRTHDGYLYQRTPTRVRHLDGGVRERMSGSGSAITATAGVRSGGRGRCSGRGGR